MNLFELEFLSFPNTCPGVKLLDYMEVLCVVFLRSLHTVSHSDYTNLHSYQKCRKVLIKTFFKVRLGRPSDVV